MGRRVGDDVVHVDLVEDDEAAGPPPEVAADRARRTRRLRLTGVLAIVVLAAVIVGADVVERRREAALLVSLRDVPGFMDPFDGPIAEVWRVSGEWAVFETDRVMVLQSDDGTRMTAIDPQSGTSLWSRDIPPGMWCQPFGEEVTATLWDRIACARARGEVDGESPGSLLVLDVAEGTVLGAHELDVPALFVHPVDGDLIIAYEGTEGRLELRRWAPEADRDVWRYSSEPGLRAEIVSDTDGWWGWGVEDGVLIIESVSVTLALDVATGDEVTTDARAGRPIVRELPDGGRVEMNHPTAISGDVLNADGSLRFRLSGQLWMPGVTDGSAPGILAARDSVTMDVFGVDAATGEYVWNAGRLPGAEPTLLVDGVAVAQGERTAVGLDMASGSTLWTAEVASSGWWPALSDGRVALLFTRSDGAAHLAAHDVRTGTVAWRVQVPDSTWYATALGRSTVLVHTDSEIIAYR